MSVLYKVLTYFRNVSKKSIETFLFAHFEINLYLCAQNHQFAIINSTMNSSSAKERRALILQMLEQKPEVQVTEISRETGISEVTIRKDLTILQSRHLLLRTRGGAMRKPVENQNQEKAIDIKRMFNFKEKERIGEEAAKLIKDGDYIMFDSGTTTLEVARHLDKFQNLHIITNAMNIATELMTYKRFDVVMIGGNMRSNSLSTVGPLALSVMRNFSRYKLFLGVDSFSIEEGISTHNMEEALLNQMMIQQAEKVIAVFDSSKFNKRSYVHVADTKQLSCIVTDRAIPTGMTAKLKSLGVEVRLV